MSQLALIPRGNAVMSACERFRYRLSRQWGEGGTVCWVMLNPSTADAAQDDPTIRRCIGFSQAWGYGSLVVVNLFALRSTSPKALYASSDRVGPENDRHIADAATTADLVVCAWGNHGALGGRAFEVYRLLPRPHYLRLTKAAQPEHPLYLPGSLRPERWFPA